MGIEIRELDGIKDEAVMVCTTTGRVQGIVISYEFGEYFLEYLGHKWLSQDARTWDPIELKILYDKFIEMVEDPEQLEVKLEQAIAQGDAMRSEIKDGDR